MAEIQNERDLILQVTVPRIIPIFIPIDKVEGLGPKLKSLRIKSTATTFSGDSVTTSPTTITLTAEKMGGLDGTVEWSVISGTGTLTPSGDSASVFGPSVVGGSISVLARVTVDTINYDAQITLTKLGKLSEQDFVDLTSQVTGQLANDNVSGLGALALLNKVDLNTQTVGALNGQTQVTNLGSLAYANSIAANQIGAGTLAAGVIYAGTVNADNITSGVITGRKIVTATSGSRVEIYTGTRSGEIEVYSPAGPVTTITQFGIGLAGNTSDGALRVQNINTSGPLITLIPRPGKPSALKEGGISYSTTHGFIFCNGTGWFTPASWTQV